MCFKLLGAGTMGMKYWQYSFHSEGTSDGLVLATHVLGGPEGLLVGPFLQRAESK
jgi:hypothetical protein